MAKKKYKDTDSLEYNIIQPWSNPVIQFRLPAGILKELRKVYKYTMSNNPKDYGDNLVGQIVEEPQVSNEIQNKFPEWINFCLSAVEEYCNLSQKQICVAQPKLYKDYQKQQIMSKITTMWFVNQKPNEYNPAHVHTGCKVSSVVYLQTPKKQIKSIKKHHDTDGKITFINNCGTDLNFSIAQATFTPKAGDMYIFAANQQHMVWPYRSKDPHDSRISMSFNADVTTEEKLKKENEQFEIMSKLMKERNKGKTDGKK